MGRSKSGRTTGNSSITKAKAKSTGAKSDPPSDPSAGPQPTNNGRKSSTRNPALPPKNNHFHPKLILPTNRSVSMNSSQSSLMSVNSQPLVPKRTSLKV